MMLSRLTRRLVTDDGSERDDEADRERLREALRLQREEEVEAVVLGREEPRGQRHEHGAEPDARERLRGRLPPARRASLRLRMRRRARAAHADGARHPELGLALGGEHHEEVHQQQQPGEHAEAPHRGEHRREALAHRFGDVERRLLRRGRPAGRAPARRRRECACSRLVGERRAALDTAAVGDRDAPGRRHAAAAAGADDVEGARARRATLCASCSAPARNRRRRAAAGRGRRGARSGSRRRGRRCARPGRTPSARATSAVIAA